MELQKKAKAFSILQYLPFPARCLQYMSVVSQQPQRCLPRVVLEMFSATTFLNNSKGAEILHSAGLMHGRLAYSICDIGVHAVLPVYALSELFPA